jgi:hypothetical protein
MKKIVVILSVIALQTAIANANVPRDWIDPDAENEFTPWAQPLANDSTEHLGSELFKFYDLTGDLVSELPEPNKAKKEKKPWYLQSMGLELGIEAEGAIGLVGLGGEAAIEMVWARTRESVARLQKKHFPNPASAATLGLDSEANASDLLLATAMTDQTLELQVDDLMKTLTKTKNLRHPSRIRQALLREVKKLTQWVGNLELTLPESSWRPYKFQTLIKLTAEGMVQPGLEVGGTIQVKLEWSLRPKQKLSPIVVPAQRSNSEFLAGLSSDFEILRPLMKKDEFYKLTNIKLGIGLGIEGDIGIAEGEAEVFGNLFWKEFPKDFTTGPTVVTAPFRVIEKAGSAKAVARSRWHRGLQKALRISQFVVKNATAYEKKKAAKTPPEKRNFELAFLEIEFEVTATGSTFLPTLSKKANADLYFIKQTRVNN